MPSTFKFVPMYTEPLTPTPPDTINAPDVDEVVADVFDKVNTPVGETEPNIVELLFCHSCKLAVCDAAPLTIKPLADAEEIRICVSPAGPITNLFVPLTENWARLPVNALT